MITKNGSCFMLSTVFFFFCFSNINLNLSERADSITANQSLSGNKTIISSGDTFELGFFRPGNSSKYYMGIWYKNISQFRRTVVWVANRDAPISDTNSAQLKISHGNLVLMNESQVSIWSTNVNSTTSKSVVATLRDDGNLVLRDGSTPKSTEVFWQSLDHPGDTWLPGGKISYDKRTRTKQLLISWKNSEDPAPGLFSLELDPNGSQYIIRWNRTKEYWTSGAWNGQIFSLVPEMRLNYIYNFTYVDNVNESYFTYSLYNPSIISRFTMDVSGQIKMTSWSDGTKEWNLFWSQPRQQCDVYPYCGPFGTCNPNAYPFYCSCLRGFKPKLETGWRLQDYSGGCVRETDLLPCGNETDIRRQDKFKAYVINVRLPDDPQWIIGRVDGYCETTCLNNCSCTAYTISGKRCLFWYEDIMNLKLGLENGDTRTIHIRLAPSAFSKNVKFTKRALIATVACSFVFVSALLGIFRVVIRRRQRRSLETTEEIDRSSVVNLVNLWGDDSTGVGVPFVSWEIILAATDNFSDVHKLGRGGFGPVYKGTFPGGKEVAVKRLSSLSTQGFNEFQNEVVLITKLQHRNLVRLVGYCIKENEKILLYEYLPNKSLDVFIFDKKLSILLNWRKRFEIILGIARGILYLHRDSRLRIIHRDLKTSNILLDEDMNPKISDFGLARIFEEDKGALANTNRVVGTYGYMSPEYASYGILSIKSDVFSFGVIILEIISGKKNTGFYQSTEAINLLSYAWRLWSENKALDLVDPILVEFCEKCEVVKCINIGLLCVEEDPVDRPTMSNVVLMLNGETTIVPVPKQPAFVMRRHVFNTSSSSSNKPDSISNELTMSEPRGR